MARGKYEYWLTKDGLLLIEGWKRDGLSDEQVARNMGCSRSTLNVWRDKYPDISDALKKGREVVVREIENALIKRARGYDYEETTEELKFNRKTGRQELVVTKRVKKHMAPDTGAAAFVLKNLKPDVWKDRHVNQVEVSTELSKLDDLIEQMCGDDK